MDMISMMVLGWLIIALGAVIAELIVWADEIFEKARHL